MKSQTRRIAYFITVPIMVVILVAVGLFIGLSIKPAKQVTFADNPAGATTPQFATTVAATAKTAKVTGQKPGTASVNLGNGETARVVIPTTDRGCSVVLQTTFAQAYQVHEGQQYLSQNSLYNLAGAAGVVLQHESTTTITSNKGDVLFVTGQYTANGVTTYMASRAFGKLYPNGLTKQLAPHVDAQFGSDPYKGVPILNMTYTCQAGGGKTTAAEFPQLLKAVSVNFG